MFLENSPKNQPVATLMLAHGAGAAMDSGFMQTMAANLAQRDIRVVRFEFPYMAARRDDGIRRPPNPRNLLLDCWGQGYISEAARACAAWFFANRADEAIWAITSSANLRSRAVMERLGMAYQPGLDFDHPRLAPGDSLLRHVTYRLDRRA